MTLKDLIDVVDSEENNEEEEKVMCSQCGVNEANGGGMWPDLCNECYDKKQEEYVREQRKKWWKETILGLIIAFVIMFLIYSFTKKDNYVGYTEKDMIYGYPEETVSGGGGSLHDF